MPLTSNESPETTVGLIGIGLVGTALAERFLAAGLAVRGHDTRAASRDHLARLGGVVEAGPGEVVAACERIVLSLPDSGIVREVIEALAPRLRLGQIVIDTTTGSPDDAIATGESLERLGVFYLDATISGSSEHVRQGEATVIAGGPIHAFEACADLFGLFAARAHHIGPCGSGSRMKLVSNLVLGLNRAALAEGLGQAHAWGLDLATTLAILRESAAYSRIMDTKGPKMVAADFTPEARLAQHHKDVRLMIESGERSGARLPLTRTHHELLAEAEAAGLGELDNSAIVELFLRPDTS
jgi:3-hydroxyisobutyrate dehydrogenase-like beta-hydroxyacid dehydrogenase